MEMERTRKKSLKKVKRILDETRLLIYYDPEKSLLSTCDASPYRLGAVLSQHRMPDWSGKPISFAFRTRSKAECNCSQVKMEVLAIAYTVKKFQQYLFRRHFFATSGTAIITKGNSKSGSCTHTTLHYFIICT